MAENIIKAHDDANRCLANTSFGQCPNIAIRDGYCPIHYGVTKDKNVKRNYAAGIWQAKLDDKVASTNIKDLRDEIGILRILLEERLNLCKNSMELMLSAQSITTMVTTIEKTVKTCHGIEQSMGQLLDKTDALQMAAEIIDIISEELKDSPDVLARVATRLEAKWK